MGCRSRSSAPAGRAGLPAATALRADLPSTALAASTPPNIVPVTPWPARVLAPARNSPSTGVRGPGRRMPNWRGVAAMPYEVPPDEPRWRSRLIGVAASSYAIASDRPGIARSAADIRRSRSWRFRSWYRGPAVRSSPTSQNACEAGAIVISWRLVWPGRQRRGLAGSLRLADVIHTPCWEGSWARAYAAYID